jgi:hypothetical protein
MALLSFLAGEGFAINDLSGSGLGFYGSDGFGSSVQVGQYQGRTFITNSTGTAQGPEADNVKWTHPGSGIVGQVGTGLGLRFIPNHQATLNIRFTHTSAIKVQNAQLRIFDRSNINNPASGVTTKTAQIIHYNTNQDNTGSGDTTWNTPGGSGSIQSLVASPGVSGLSPNGPDTTNIQHDWYVALSASPDSIGSKTQFGLYCALEYL